MPSADHKKSIISNVPLFKGLKDRQIENLADRMIKRSFDAGDVIVEQGHGGEGFYIISTGSAEALRVRSDGEKIVVNKFGPTDFFGELALLDDTGVRTASIVATSPTTCFVLIRWDFIASLRQDADMAVYILQELAKRFRIALDSL